MLLYPLFAIVCVRVNQSWNLYKSEINVKLTTGSEVSTIKVQAKFTLTTLTIMNDINSSD